MSADSKRRFDDSNAAQQRFLSLFLRSEREIANAVSVTVEEIHETIRDLVRRGEVFEPIPRRYLRRERRLGERRGVAERRKAPRPAADRRHIARRASKG